jgi:hypothetical protein
MKLVRDGTIPEDILLKLEAHLEKIGAEKACVEAFEDMWLTGTGVIEIDNEGSLKAVKVRGENAQTKSKAKL